MAKVKCPKCFHVNPDGQDQCVRCNAPLPKIRIDAQPRQTPPRAEPGEPGELQFSRGQIVAARYSVLNLIGRGGMGAIYKVHDNVLGETVALKTLLPQFVRDKMVVERFFNEAKIARRLAHPNIVRVHDIGNAEGSIYISMEYVQGISLRSMLEGLPAGQRLALNKVLAIIDALCAALEYAHQYTIHRDIKPENVMVTAEGTVKLMDFGISKLMADTRMTAASMVMGTPFYMSPEQLKNSRDVDARADIYSVGVLLYETLTGNVPTGVPKPASQISSEVPPTMDAIIMKCVAPDPRERYANATELRAALKPIIDLVQSGRNLTRVQPSSSKEARAVDVPWRKVAGWVLLAGLTAGSIALLLTAESQRKAKLAEAALALESAPAPEAPVESGAISWQAFKDMIKEMDDLGTHMSADFPDIYRRARELWQRIRDKDGALTADEQIVARRALQYYVATLIANENRDMVFVGDPNVETGGAKEAIEPFFIDKQEVKNADWGRFVASTKGEHPAAPQGAELYPMVNVSYFDAVAFAAAQGKLLPTDEEWTAAAYAALPSDSEFPWGPDFEPGQANVNNLQPDGGVQPVGSFTGDHTPNGIDDLAGNVAEWTRTPATPGETPDFGTEMVVRGGSFNSAPIPLMQESAAPFETAAPGLGFRCVREIPTDPAAVQEIIHRLAR